MKKKKILKTILIILLAILLLIAIHTIRNFMIITNLQNKMQDYANITNYSVKNIQTTNGKEVLIVKYYQKENKALRILERIQGTSSVTISEYYDNGTVKMFITSPESKTVRIGNEISALKPQKISSNLETENIFQTIIACFIAKIRSEEYNGKDCYAISEFISPMILNDGSGMTDYYEKDTGLHIKYEADGSEYVKEYQFNNVDDNVFIEPDISEYTLQENN
ncbi:MAG: hypothetical protein J6A36_04760 [Clostridia bacterium]|nr:hypothetical protein [Clostridia bacterium]